MSDGFRPKPRIVYTGKGGGTATLPPAGAARKEELKRRSDQLEEAVAAMPEGGVIDPAKLEVESELAQHFDELNVTNANPAYHYCWVNMDYPSGSKGLMARKKLAQRGWEMVNGDMPEAMELRQPDGTRRLGDVVLMRITKERHALLEQKDADVRASQQQAVTSNLQALGNKHRGVKVHVAEDMPEHMKKIIEHPSPQAVNAMRGTMAAKTKLDQGLRDGTIAGVK